MDLCHNTLDVFYRSPRGAVPAGTRLRLRVALCGSLVPERVDLRVWNGNEHCYPMQLLGARDGKIFYVGRAQLKKQYIISRFRIKFEGRVILQLRFREEIDLEIRQPVDRFRQHLRKPLTQRFLQNGQRRAVVFHQKTRNRYKSGGRSAASSGIDGV